MRRALLSAVVLLSVLAQSAQADPAAEARRLYAEFAAAQNANDLGRVRALLADGDSFLWVSNGLSIWGPEAAIARLARFHANEIWHIVPDERRARAVTVAPDVAFLHVPLVLTVGQAADPQRYRILISALCVETAAGWRIAALFTTDENTGGPGAE